MTIKIGILEYHEWEKNYWRNFNNKAERFGQAFCNHFKITNPLIFNMEDSEAVAMKIHEHYISE